LQTAYYAGFVIAAMSFVLALYIIARQLITGFPVPGWASLMVAILFLGSVQLVCAGILGEYVGRIYDEVKQRPLFLVDHEASRGAQA
jgi:glycosyltransferase involved in cell wall biosynthesis